MTKEERENRIIARGESGNHAHAITGDCVITRNKEGEILIEVGQEGAVLKHIMESDWMAGKEVWTEEHSDIAIPEGRYKYIPQVEYHPYEKAIQQVRD